jgi:hypothetical protein
MMPGCTLTIGDKASTPYFGKQEKNIVKNISKDGKLMLGVKKQVYLYI